MSLSLSSYSSMEILSSNRFLPLSPLSLKSLPIKNPNPSSLFPPRLNPTPKPKLLLISCSLNTTAPISTFNGWDDLDLLEDSTDPLDLGPVRRFLISSGFDDPKHALTFSLGFLSALALSRVRFSSLFVLPVSALVFAVGFSAGAARFRVFTERFRDLESFLGDLMSGVENGGELRLDSLDTGKIKSFIDAIESVKKNVESSIVGEFLNGHLDFYSGGGKRSNMKASKKRKDFDFTKYLGALIQENLVGAETPKASNNSKSESIEHLDSVKDGIEYRENDRIKEKVLSFSKNSGRRKESEEGNLKHTDTALRYDTPVRPVRNFAEATENKKLNRSKVNGRYVNDILSYEEDLNRLDRKFSFTSKQESFARPVFKQKYEHLSLQSDGSHSIDSGMDFFSTRAGTSSLVENRVQISDESYKHLNRSKHTNQFREVKEAPVNPDDRYIKGTQQPAHIMEDANLPASATITFDEEFNQYMQEATDLLKQARECMKSQAKEETTDSILCKTANLLSAAEAMRPMSLLAVGQLGNTYLLHGELKLKISRELRTLLLRSEASLTGRGRFVQSKKLSSSDLSKEDVESTLVEVCEECEDLLVKAGRKYRTALSIDGNDLRALYNWGLALSFRAQLVADIGPEAAVDADKIYLAAIDKFDAMMSRSNVYATDALYRWGTVLQQRSYLRPRNNREKVKLLHQAKSLFEDVLSMESDNLQVREALVSCVSELDYNGRW